MSLLRLLLSEPMIEPFVQCPNCGRTLRPGVESCPECSQVITAEYARSNVVAVMLRSQACDMKNEVTTFDPAAVILFILTAVAFAWVASGRELSLSFPVLVLISAVLLLSVLVWFYRYGRLADDDDEYLRAKREMKRRLTLWLTLLAVQLITTAFWLF
jgi:hypothetical protein